MDKVLKYIIFSGMIFLLLICHYQSKKLTLLQMELKKIKSSLGVLSTDFTNEMNANLEPGARYRLDRLQKINQLIFDFYPRMYYLENIVDSLKPKDSSSFLSPPFAHYKCDETEGFLLRDSGYGQAMGVSAHNLRNISTTGVIDHGVQLNGSNECIYINDLQADLLNDSQGSWSFWIKPDLDKVGAVFSVGSSKQDEVFMVQIRNDHQLGFGFSGPANAWFYEAKVLDDSKEWIHIAIVQDGKNPVIYRNGVLVRAAQLEVYDSKKWFADFPNLDNGRIGCLNHSQRGDNTFYRGAIDDIRYYKRVLSAAEVEAIYKNNHSANFSNDISKPGM